MIVAARREAAIVLALTTLLTIVPLVPPPAAASAALGILALTTVAWRSRAPAATSLGLLSSTCVVLGLTGFGPQQVVFPIAFAIYAGVVRRVTWLRSAAAWFTRGELTVRLFALAVGIAAVSAMALLVWYALLEPELSDLGREFVPDLPIWVLVPGALVFSMVNAAIEEAAYRGVVLSALDGVLDSPAVAIVLQAAAFGALHLHGFPRGMGGVVLAFVYGLALGALCRTARGLLAPWIAHVLTDIVIVSIVIALARM